MNAINIIDSIHDRENFRPLLIIHLSRDRPWRSGGSVPWLIITVGAIAGPATRLAPVRYVFLVSGWGQVFVIDAPHRTRHRSRYATTRPSNRVYGFYSTIYIHHALIRHLCAILGLGLPVLCNLGI